MVIRATWTAIAVNERDGRLEHGAIAGFSKRHGKVRFEAKSVRAIGRIEPVDLLVNGPAEGKIGAGHTGHIRDRFGIVESDKAPAIRTTDA